MKPVVRQMRGPGMNKGLKKPRHGQFKDPEPAAKKSAAMRSAEAQGSSGERKNYSKGSSYLSGNIWK
jgi:hypothetical protein